MAIFFTSDTHFGHAKIIAYCDRPFEDVQEMNEALVERWNNTVKKNDVVYHLGDFAICNSKDAIDIAFRLNGTIHLVEGNHDSQARNIQQCTRRFASYKQINEITIAGQKIVLCHYALRTWHHDFRESWHLYGHSHGRLPGYGKSLDVGVDVWNFRPLSFEEVHALMEVRQIGEAPRFASYDTATV